MARGSDDVNSAASQMAAASEQLSKESTEQAETSWVPKEGLTAVLPRR